MDGSRRHEDARHVERPAEMPAVRTTIVGGRPPGPGKAVGDVPRRIEILVKKASVDAGFRSLLVDKRADAAREIGLELDAAEAAMLHAVPASQLEAIVAGARVTEKQRPAFLGRAAAVMLAALGAGATGCRRFLATDGVRPDRPPKVEPAPEKPADAQATPDAGPPSGDIPADRSEPE